MLFKPAFSLLAPAGARARLSILIFHRVLAAPDPLFPDEVDARRFDDMMGWVARWLHVLPLDEAVARLQEGSLPARAAVISFDDGYADNYTLALPILQRHGLTATFFIASGFLDGGRMWNDSLIEAVRATALDHLETGLDSLPRLDLRTQEQRRQALQQLIPAVKHLAPHERAQAVERIASRCAVNLPTDLMLTTAQLRGLQQAGMQIGAHTLNHPILATSSAEDARHEIAASKQQLESLLDQPVTLFAYPNGKPGQDYLPGHVGMVKSLGFTAAVSTQWGVNTRHSDVFQLRRFTPWDTTRGRFGLRLLNNMMSG